MPPQTLSGYAATLCQSVRVLPKHGMAGTNNVYLVVLSLLEDCMLACLLVPHLPMIPRYVTKQKHVNTEI